MPYMVEKHVENVDKTGIIGIVRYGSIGEAERRLLFEGMVPVRLVYESQEPA